MTLATDAQAPRARRGLAPLALAQRIAGTTLINVVRISPPGGIGTVRALSRRAGRTRAEARELDISRSWSLVFRVMLIGMDGLVVSVGAALVVNSIGRLAVERR